MDELKVGDVCWFVGDDARELVQVVDVVLEFADQRPFYTVTNPRVTYHAWLDDLEPWEPVDVADNEAVETWLG